MTDLKPSELPKKSVIEMNHELYIKGDDGVWEIIDVGCGCCNGLERIADDGCDDTWDDSRDLTETKKSDDYFKDFELIAMPITVVNKLALWLEDELDRTDVLALIKEAVEEVNTEEN